MSARVLRPDQAPSVKDVAPHIERIMHARTGSVTLHFVNGKFQRVEYRLFEDATAMPREAE